MDTWKVVLFRQIAAEIIDFTAETRNFEQKSKKKNLLGELVIQFHAISA